MEKLLLTTVFRPFGVADPDAEEDKYNKREDDLLLDYLASRLTREPGLFELSSYVPNSGIHLIAANLPVACKVMEWPSIEEFTEEVKKGYEYIGIQFIIKGFGKVIRMISVIRKYAPATRIVLGGFGTILDEAENMGADFVCKGEGVGYMRKLLGYPGDMEIVHPVITSDITLKIFQNYNFLDKHKIGLLTSGFGCPGKCEYCVTSAYFGGENVPFLKTGTDIYNAMLYMAGNANVSNFLIFEEDFALYDEKVKTLTANIRDDEKHDFSFGCFSSVKSLSNHNLEDLAAGGADHIWIGIESKYSHLADVKEGHFDKRVGRAAGDIFKELHALGVTTTASSIMGLEHHTPQMLPEEVDYLISLNPSTFQISNLMAASGTKTRERLESSKRIVISGYKHADLYSEVAKHPNFPMGELTQAVFKGYRDVYDKIGPAVFRIYNTWFTGYKNLRHSANKALKRRAGILKDRVRNLLPLFLKTQAYLPNDEIRALVADTVGEVIAEFRQPTPAQLDQAVLIEKIFALEAARKKIIQAGPIEPVLLTRYYNSDFFDTTRKAYRELSAGCYV